MDELMCLIGLSNDVAQLCGTQIHDNFLVLHILPLPFPRASARISQRRRHLKPEGARPAQA